MKNFCLPLQSYDSGWGRGGVAMPLCFIHFSGGVGFVFGFFGVSFLFCFIRPSGTKSRTMTIFDRFFGKANITGLIFLKSIKVFYEYLKKVLIEFRRCSLKKVEHLHLGMSKFETNTIPIGRSCCLSLSHFGRPGSLLLV